MTVFWIIAVALTAAALLFVLPPLLRRPEHAPEPVDRDRLTVAIYKDQMAELEADLRSDTITQEQYEQGRQELERRLLDDVPQEADGQQAVPRAAAPSGRWAAIMVGIAVPVAVAALYLVLGTPEALKPPGEQIASATVKGGTHGESSEQIMALVEQLESRLKKHPDDAQGWAILGRSYLVLEQFPQARHAFDRAVQLNRNDPQLLVDYADALAMDRKDQSLEGRPMELVDRALKLDPNNQKGLWLAGTAAYERHDYKAALTYWEKLYTMVPPGSDAAKAMESNISEVRSLISSVGSAEAPDEAPKDATQTAMASTPADAVIRGQVSLAPDLKAKAQPGDVVYIFARAPPGGPPMPLAIIKAQVKDLPMQFTLDDSKSIMPSAKLSGFTHAVVAARISMSGDASAHSGDLQGVSPVIAVGATGVDVVIDQVVP
jgi:cytochrome c-type biogenesis protein CcmH